MAPWSNMIAGKVPVPPGFVKLAMRVSLPAPLMVTISEGNPGVTARIPMNTAMTIWMDTMITLLVIIMSSLRGLIHKTLGYLPVAAFYEICAKESIIIG
jgi:hypothetical protein